MAPHTYPVPFLLLLHHIRLLLPTKHLVMLHFLAWPPPPERPDPVRGESNNRRQRRRHSKCDGRGRAGGAAASEAGEEEEEDCLRYDSAKKRRRFVSRMNVWLNSKPMPTSPLQHFKAHWELLAAFCSSFLPFGSAIGFELPALRALLTSASSRHALAVAMPMSTLGGRGREGGRGRDGPEGLDRADGLFLGYSGVEGCDCYGLGARCVGWNGKRSCRADRWGEKRSDCCFG